jgi:hypothetical protein
LPWTTTLSVVNFVKEIIGRPYSECSRSSLNWSEIKPNILLDLKKDLNLKNEDVINLFISNERYWYYLKDQVDQKNANVDRLIYDWWQEIKKINPDFKGDKPILGGDGYGDVWTNPHFSFDESDKSEFMYKYLYGFHKTEYGQALIASQNVSLEDFIQKGIEEFNWVEFNQNLKKHLDYYNPLPKSMSSEDGVKGLEFKVDLNHWNNDYLIFNDLIISFNYQDYMEDNGWLEYDDKIITNIKDQLLNFIKSEFSYKSDFTDTGESLIINQMPTKIWHQTKNPIRF